MFAKLNKRHKKTKLTVIRAIINTKPTSDADNSVGCLS